MNIYEEYGEHTAIEYETLTDGSIAHNVLLSTPSGDARIGCESEKHAMDVADALESACWIEFTHLDLDRATEPIPHRSPLRKVRP